MTANVLKFLIDRIHTNTYTHNVYAYKHKIFFSKEFKNELDFTEILRQNCTLTWKLFISTQNFMSPPFDDISCHVFIFFCIITDKYLIFYMIESKYYQFLVSNHKLLIFFIIFCNLIIIISYQFVRQLLWHYYFYEWNTTVSRHLHTLFFMKFSISFIFTKLSCIL